MNKKILSLITAGLILIPALVSCSSTTATTSDTSSSDGAAETTTSSSEQTSSASKVITLTGDTAECSSSDVYIDGGKVSITAAGTYTVTGTLNDGQIYVECVNPGEVNLILDNADITNDDNACIFIKTAQLVTLTLKDGTTNTLTDGAYYNYDNPTDDEPNSTLFSKADLTITGNGSLSVTANYLNGIVSKDTLKIESGDIKVTAANAGIKGKDALIINGGTITVDAGGDGLKASSEKTELVGYVEINGGNLIIVSDDEAIQAVTNVNITGGTIEIDSTNNGIKAGVAVALSGGTIAVNADDNAIDAPTITKTGADVTVNGVPYNG